MNKIMKIGNRFDDFERKFCDAYGMTPSALVGVIVSVVCFVSGILTLDLKEVAIGYLLYMVVSMEYVVYEDDEDSNKD